MEKEISNNELAEMVKYGFDEMATKKDLESLATKKELKEGLDDLKNSLETNFINQFDGFRSDLRKVKTKLEMP